MEAGILKEKFEDGESVYLFTDTLFDINNKDPEGRRKEINAKYYQKRKEKVVAPAKPERIKVETQQIDYKRIVDLYHESLPTLPKCVMITEKRKKQIKSCYQIFFNKTKDEDKAYASFKWYFDSVSRMPFYIGQNDKNWRADIDFLTTSSKFVSMCEKIINQTKGN